MKQLRLTACEFMVYKDYEIDLKCFFPTSSINFKIQNFTCFYVYQHIIINYYIFWSSCQAIFLNVLSLSFLSYTFSFITCCLFKFIQAFYTNRAIYTRDNLFTLNNGVVNGFFKLLLCFHTVSAGYIQLLYFL